MTITELKKIALDEIKLHITPVYKYDKPVFLISKAYKGIWLEHVYDSIIYGDLFNDYSIAINTINLFIDLQTNDGLYPYSIKDEIGPSYYQIQECVSFIRLAYIVYEKTNDLEFLKKVYESGKKYISWLEKYRMTRKLGLVEMFVGYDTGHDNSARLDNLKYKQNYSINSIKKLATELPECNTAPVIAVDMNTNFYSNLINLSKIAKILGFDDEANTYSIKALKVKELIFKYCYDEKTNFFYDLDKNNNFIYVKSSTILHLFLEGVLNKNEDIELIDILTKKYIFNKNEFYTKYPFPSVSISDKSWLSHKIPNSWGYYSQALIALRCSLWMDNYGYSKEYDHLLKKWVDGIVKNYNNNPFAQELDPITGDTSSASPNYSTTLLLFIYAIKRLKF